MYMLLRGTRSEIFVTTLFHKKSMTNNVGSLCHVNWSDLVRVTHCAILTKAEVRRSFITTTIREQNPNSESGRMRPCVGKSA